MGSHLIQSVLPVRDAVDRLEWRARISPTTGMSEQVFITEWTGSVVFYKERVPANTSVPAARISLQARWMNRQDSSRCYRGSDVGFIFGTDLPGDSLDRIEAFREGGPLFARLEGTIFVVFKNSPGTPHLGPWFDDMAQIMGMGNRVMGDDVRSETFDVRGPWCTEIMTKLRPEGRFVFDVTVHLGAPDGDVAARALDRFREAQNAFNDGRHGETARLCYRSLDEAKKLGDRVERRYGAFARARIQDEMKALSSLCNPERHAEQEAHDGLEFDRPLAQSLLAGTGALLGTVLK